MEGGRNNYQGKGIRNEDTLSTTTCLEIFGVNDRILIVEHRP